MKRLLLWSLRTSQRFILTEVIFWGVTGCVATIAFTKRAFAEGIAGFAGGAIAGLLWATIMWKLRFRSLIAQADGNAASSTAEQPARHPRDRE